MINLGITLGHTVTDKHTGFTGVAMGRAEYLYGCVRVLVESPTEKDKNSEPLSLWLDEQRLTSESSADVGGPQDDAPKY